MIALVGCAAALVAVGPEQVPEASHDVPHPDAQTEWWHVHAELEDAAGDPLYVFAAFLVQRTAEDRVGPLPLAWFAGEVHLAYAKLQTADGAWSSDRVAWPDLLAARFVGDGLDLRHDDWRIAREHDSVVLSVDVGPHAVDLVLDPTRPPTLPGDAGRVELVPGSAHLWVQEEHLAVRGRWRDGRETRWVEGVGFYKHQWGRLYDPELDGFTWISLDLDGSTSLSVAWLHDDGLRGVPGSMAWLSTADGVVPLPVGALQLTPERAWRGRSGASWPVAWRLDGPGIHLRIEALRDDQELRVAPAPLHVGPAWAVGELFGRPVDGVAFLEQAGGRVPPTRALYRSDPPEAR